MVEEEKKEENVDISEEEAIIKIAQAMKDNAPSQEDKQNVHTFLTNVVKEEGVEHSSKIGNLRDDKEINELGVPMWNVRGCLEMARISNKIIGNDFFKEYFESAAIETLGTSLSREGFLIRQATTTTKAVADVTKRRKMNKGMFGASKRIESSGGDPYTNSGESS